MALLGIFLAYIITCFIILYKNRNNLADKNFNETYGAMTLGLKLNDKNCIYIYPIFMLKRLVFSMLVIIFFNRPGQQIQALIILQLSYTIFLICTKSAKEFKQFIIDIFNEICLGIVYFHLFNFGDSGIVNASDNKISIDERIQFIQNLSLSFDFFGILIIIFNFAFLTVNLGQQII